MKVIRLNIHEAKTHLSRYLKGLTADDRIILCNRNRPVAEVRLLPSEPRGPQRRIGVAKGEFQVPEAFLEALPDDVLSSFEGQA
jgi:antitoxin (DNA-binding transcriptional repressor) of toxin-antitoxin stability system